MKGQKNLRSCAVVRGRRRKQFTISGGDDEGVPPVPIPNTEVKPLSADGTWLETARESRTSPDSKEELGREGRKGLPASGNNDPQ